ncbi:M28 family metallopeptidase [Phenylobacterium deserti]|uniref:Peptidase M28 n=1 Tax=Phenylobacterium deserti TaxID=1914756 RepID=A0A328AWF0_9CAUL|nr:M28 family metallopeptidase [Phenylobacterium deserti]RAK57904.1 peptidase M28 [Phenylobacterium deserti]
MRTALLGLVALTAFAGGASAQSSAPQSPSLQTLSPRAQTWRNDIAVLSHDNMEGRLTGSAGYLRAADYVEKRFREEGLAPAGDNGTFRQNVEFVQQLVDQKASRATLIGGASPLTLTVGEDVTFAAGGAPRPERISAPLVFIGYGLHLPDHGYDDFAGVDLKGKIAVVLSGGPANIPGTVKAAARFERIALLGKAGAVGLITLTTPKQVEIPWARGKLSASQPGMFLADASLRDMPDGFLSVGLNPDLADKLFEGSGHSFAEVSAIADASGKLPTFNLARGLDAQVVSTRTTISSPNVVAKLEGSDPTLKAQYVALSAHLDHFGVGAAINGDSNYNGAMDDASGVASVIGIAHQLKVGQRPKRSVLFVVVTAEEKGLLGSNYFARKPTVPAGSIVADLNLDMPLPLWPLKSVIVQGADESTLGVHARAAAAAMGLTVAPDPLPDRNSFIRTDQFSFVRQGVPALAFKFGFAKGTPEFEIERQWRANVYHSPADEVDQPGVYWDEAVKLDEYVGKILERTANAPERPTWRPTSVFRRYLKN